MRSVIFISIIFVAVGCSKILLKSTDNSWPVEAVVKVNDSGFIYDERYAFDLNVKPIFYEEFNDSNSVAGKEIRIIRDRTGLYYFTGAGFKSIYRFIPVEGGMKLEDKIELPDTAALKSPAFNQKLTNIELIDGLNKYLVSGKEIARTK